jgi:peptide deformylase
MRCPRVRCGVPEYDARCGVPEYDALARIIQHEIDHLDGVLFIDRVTEESKQPIADEIAKFERIYRERTAAGELGSDAVIQAEIQKWEQKFC